MRNHINNEQNMVLIAFSPQNLATPPRRQAARREAAHRHRRGDPGNAEGDVAREPHTLASAPHARRPVVRMMIRDLIDQVCVARRRGGGGIRRGLDIFIGRNVKLHKHAGKKRCEAVRDIKCSIQWQPSAMTVARRASSPSSTPPSRLTRCFDHHDTVFIHPNTYPPPRKGCTQKPDAQQGGVPRLQN